MKKLLTIMGLITSVICQSAFAEEKNSNIIESQFHIAIIEIPLDYGSDLSHEQIELNEKKLYMDIIMNEKTVGEVLKDNFKNNKSIELQSTTIRQIEDVPSTIYSKENEKNNKIKEILLVQDSQIINKNQILSYYKINLLFQMDNKNLLYRLNDIIVVTDNNRRLLDSQEIRKIDYTDVGKIETRYKLINIIEQRKE